MCVCERGTIWQYRIWKNGDSDTRKLRKNSELRVRIERSILQYTKELPFPSKMVYKRVRGWTPGRNQ